MSSTQSDLYFPRDWLAVIIYMTGIPLLMGILMPTMARAMNTNPTYTMLASYAAGLSGVILLFLARLPLYRQGRFWTFGSKELDRPHRFFYNVAYVFIVVCIILILITWAIVKYHE